jgi:hypothetical protein
MVGYYALNQRLPFYSILPPLSTAHANGNFLPAGSFTLLLNCLPKKGQVLDITAFGEQTYFPVYLYSCSRTTHQREGVPHLLSRKSGVHGLAGSSTPLPQARRSSY